MQWNGIKITINNYNEVFKNYSIDIREIIRSAVLDGTPIEHYIDKFKNDPYLLWQVKLSIDEGISPFWFNGVVSGRLLYSIRELNRRGINIEYLAEYFSLGLQDDYYEYIIKWYSYGYNISKYNFDILPKNLLSVFDYGLSLNFPMYMFNNGVNFSEEYIMCCLKILSNEKDISIFLNGDWNIENLELLSKYSRSRYYDTLVKYISIEITPFVLDELFECCRVGMPLDDVAVVDDGVYIYSGVHISLIRQAFLDKLDYRCLLDSTLAIKELHSKLDNLKSKTGKKVSGILNKNK